MMALNLILICAGPFAVVFGVLAVVERQILGEAQTNRHIVRTVAAASRHFAAVAGPACRSARVRTFASVPAWFPARLRGGSR